MSFRNPQLWRLFFPRLLQGTWVFMCIIFVGYAASTFRRDPTWASASPCIPPFCTRRYSAQGPSTARAPSGSPAPGPRQSGGSRRDFYVDKLRGDGASQTASSAGDARHESSKSDARESRSGGVAGDSTTSPSDGADKQVAVDSSTGSDLSSNSSQVEGKERRALSGGYPVPAWCSELMKGKFSSRLRYAPDCRRREENSILCNDGTPTFFGQYGQDAWLYHTHFANLGRPGVYLDVAANNAVDMSNTFFMDRCLGWRGICVEADPRYHPLLREQRSCQLLPTCVSDHIHQAEFVSALGLGGIIETNKNYKDFVRDGSFAYKRKFNLTCTTLALATKAASIQHVDYMSLDVEGHELQVLHGIDWNATTIDFITVEMDKGPQESQKVIRYLQERGYTFIPEGTSNRTRSGQLFKLSYDSAFVHERVGWGRNAIE